MKKTSMGIMALIVFAAIGLWVAGKDTRVITTEIEINASPDKVWTVLANINDWKNWSPIIKDSSGEAKMDSKLVITMISEEGKEGKPGPRYEPVITVFEKYKNLTWSAKMMAGFVMTNGKVLILEKTSLGTKLIHKETFSGLMVPMMWGKVQENVPEMLDLMNSTLKKIVEDK
jgi:hypothetical protein